MTKAAGCRTSSRRLSVVWRVTASRSWNRSTSRSAASRRTSPRCNPKPGPRPRSFFIHRGIRHAEDAQAGEPVHQAECDPGRSAEGRWGPQGLLRPEVAPEEVSGTDKAPGLDRKSVV